MTKIKRPNLCPCPFCHQSPHWDWDTNKVRCSKGHTVWLPVDVWNESGTEVNQMRADLEAATMKRDILAAQVKAIRLRDDQRDAEVVERARSEWDKIEANALSPRFVSEWLRGYANQLRIK